MLSEAIRDRARALSETRMVARDTSLKTELRRLAERVSRIMDEEDELPRMTVRLRLICEQDLAERARIAWQAVQMAHQEMEGTRRQSLLLDLRDEVNTLMRAGGIRLAGKLREQDDGLRQLFIGSQAIDASWLARQRNRATEQVSNHLQEYVAGLSFPLVLRLKRFFGISTKS